MTVPYSSQLPQSIGQLNNVEIDTGTLANDDIIKYSTASNTWVNGATSTPAPIAGSVIQTIFNSSSTPTTITSGNQAAPDATAVFATITPKDATSYILGTLDIHLSLRALIADGGIAVKIWDGASYVFSQGNVAHMGFYIYGGAGDQNDEVRCLQSMKFYIPSTTTNARTYTAYCYLYPIAAPNMPSGIVNENNSLSFFTLQEIQQ